MSHTALVLEPGDTIYVGMMDAGNYVEVRVSNTQGALLVSHPDGNMLVEPK